MTARDLQDDFSILFVNCKMFDAGDKIQSNLTKKIPRPEMCERQNDFGVLYFLMLINSNGFSSQFPVKKSIIIDTDYSLGSYKINISIEFPGFLHQQNKIS